MSRIKIKNLFIIFFLVMGLMLFLSSCGSGSNGPGNTPGAEKTNANLSALTISNGTLTFNPDTTAYPVEVAYTVSSMTATATPNQKSATMKINGINAVPGAASGPINLNVGQNTIKIVVTSSDGSATKTYTIVVTRLAAPVLSSNANLSNITLSSGTLSPGFNENTTAYNVQVPYSVPSVAVTPLMAGVNATITVNGNAVVSGATSPSVALNTGLNTITIILTAEDGTTTKTYTVSVTQLAEPSHNANLANLTLSQGTLSPGFNENTIAYNVQVPYNITTMTLTPTVADSNSTITINNSAINSGSPSQAVALTTGNNTITVVVTAQDGTTTKTYTVSVTQLSEPSHNANLANLTLSQGTLSPAFDENTIGYTVQVPYTVTTMTLTPTVSDSDATITVNDTTASSGLPSQTIALSTGDNTITLIVTAQDGTITKTYTVVVTQLGEPSHNANLANLTLSSGILSPAFDGNTNTYTAQIPNTISSITVTPTSADSHSTVLVNGQPIVSGTSSLGIPLNVGDNSLSIQVTAQDGSTTQIYSVTVTRLITLSNNAYLSNLTLSSGTLNPLFTNDGFNYSASVSSNTSEITVTPTCAGVNANVLVNGAAVFSGTSSLPVLLQVGPNIITIEITAEDTVTTQVYMVSVYRVAVAGSVSSSQFWSEFHGNNQRTGLSKVDTSANDGTLKWKFFNLNGAYQFYTPVIGPDGTIYIGSADNYLYAINSDGSLKWRYFADGPVSSSEPAVASDGTIFFQVQTSNDFYVIFYAVNPDGSLKWKYQAGQSYEMILSSPAIGGDGTIYFGSSFIDNNYTGYLYAFNSDGSLKWKYQTGDAGAASPAIGTDGTIYIGAYVHDYLLNGYTFSAHLYAINPDGTLKWDYKLLDLNCASPAIGPDGTIYVVTYYGYLYAINPDGSFRWKYTMSQKPAVYCSPAIGPDGTIYVGNQSEQSATYCSMYALTPDGSLKWEKTLGNIGYFCPTIGAEGTIYIPNYTQQSIDANGPLQWCLTAINSDGSNRWEYQMPLSWLSYPVIAPDGTIYMGGNDGYLYAIGH